MWNDKSAKTCSDRAMFIPVRNLGAVMRRQILSTLVLASTTLSSLVWRFAPTARADNPAQPAKRVFYAGVRTVDIAPEKFPVLVNGGFLPSRATQVIDPIRAKASVLDDGATRLVIVVVDSCMLPRELIDQAKALAREKTGIPTERMLISATHTHSAPAAMGALGCPADAGYAANLPERIADVVSRAALALEPARIGWSAIDDPAHTFCRRWIRRPDKMIDDPFGQRTVRANMHPGYQNPDVIGPSGPVDTALTVLSIQGLDGRPIAVLANYSMHYYGAQPVSADYFGRFAAALAQRIGASSVDPPFVAIMSQGTSGDQMWMDYGQPKKDPGLDSYAQDVARRAHQAYQTIAYHEWVPLAMAEKTLALSRRVPDETRLAWARKVGASLKDGAKERPPRDLPEVYAQEAIFLHEEPRRELKLQAIRIGDLGIAAIPNEVFAITGLKLKAQSPFDTTMNIELANGSEGYIPPPEQHALGGYTTWPARTAGLEVEAEPKIVAAVLELLEQVAGKPRRRLRTVDSAYAKAVLASRPLAYWRLDDIQGPTATDATGHGHEANYEGGVAFFLPGPELPGLTAGSTASRAVHLAGGRARAKLDGMQNTYTLELWFWNGLPNQIRPITGVIVSRAIAGRNSGEGDQLAIGGTQAAAGRFVLTESPASKPLFGKTEIAPRTWHHLTLTREASRVSVYLDGNTEPEMTGELAVGPIGNPPTWFIGGRLDGIGNFEGKISDVALFDRVIPAAEIASHVHAARAGGGSKIQP
jgi:hypothetical protein